MKQLSIVFTKGLGFAPFSWAIMWGLKTPFSHVAIRVIDPETNQGVYYQASGTEVNCVSEDEFLSSQAIVYKKDIVASEAVFVKGKIFAINQLGKPYSYLAILGFMLQIILGWVKIKISNPFKENGSQYVCSQFAGAFVDACENIKMDITNMTPLALYNAIQTLPTIWS